MHSRLVVGGLLLALAVLSGCKQQCFITECDYNHYRELIPQNIEKDPRATLQPVVQTVPEPRTVLDPERPVRFLTLNEAIALALQNGRVGAANLSGQVNDSLIQFTGRGVTAPDAIRVFGLDPAIQYTDIETSLSRFDARLTASANWTHTDNALGNQFVPGLQQQQFNSDRSTVRLGLLKPLPTGGTAGITFDTTYNKFAGDRFGGIPNPFYQPRYTLQFEQPLLQGYGVDINQLRQTHPGSILTPFNTNTRAPEGILISRLRFDQQRAEFERNVHILVANVEAAYWNLYGAYWTLYSREQALRQAYESYKISRIRFDAGRIAIQDLAQVRQQYESFRAQRVEALGEGLRTGGGGVLESERRLRQLLGLPPEDGVRLVPGDEPTLTPYRPDWHVSVNEALALRPELTLIRQELKTRQLDLINVRNLLLPDVRVAATYGGNGIGGRLDGPSNDNALRSLSSNRFNDWEIRLQGEMPIGFREAHAATRQARLNLARTYEILQDQEERVQFSLAAFWNRIFESYQLIIINRAQREAAAQQLEARFREFQAGRGPQDRGPLDLLLEAQRFFADALRDEHLAIAQYNTALAQFQYAKGTILSHNNVHIAEGPLPHCAKLRAIEHERLRDKAIVLRERPAPDAVLDCGPDGCLSIPKLPEHRAATLPEVLKEQPPLPPPITEGTMTLPPLSTNKTPAPVAVPEFGEKTFRISKPADTGEKSFNLSKPTSTPNALPATSGILELPPAPRQ